MGALIALGLFAASVALVVAVGRWAAPGNRWMRPKGGSRDGWWPHNYGGED